MKFPELGSFRIEGELYPGTDAQKDLPIPNIGSFALKNPAREAFTDKTERFMRCLRTSRLKRKKRFKHPASGSLSDCAQLYQNTYHRFEA